MLCSYRVLSHKHIVSYLPPWNESTLRFINNFYKNSLQSVSEHFEHNLVAHIAQTNRMEFGNFLGGLDFWNETNKSMQHTINNIFTNYIPVLLVENWRHTVGPENLIGCIC